MKRIISLALCFIMAFSLCQPVFAASTITWNGEAGDGLWHTAGNWDLAQVPMDGDSVIIPESSVVEYVYGETSVRLNCAGNLTVSSGTLKLASGNSSLTKGKLDGAGDITVATGGNFLWSGGSIEGTGKLTIEDNANFYAASSSLDRYLVNNGSLLITGSSLSLTGGAEGDGNFSIQQDNTLELGGNGSYNLSSSVSNMGTLKILNTCTAANFNSGYTQQTTGTLEFDIGGLNDFTPLEVTGNVILNGELKINLLDGYIPSLGDTFEIMTYSSRYGEFSSIVSNTVGITFEPTFTDTGLTLTVSGGTEPGGYMCKVGDVGYDTLDGALEAVMYGGTIQLLRNIDYDGGIFIDGADITFDLNGFALNVNNSTGTGLKVKGGGAVEYINEGTTGSFNVTGYEFGVWAEDAGTVVRVTNATSGGSTAYNYAVFAKNSAEVIVENDVTVSGQYSTGISANGGVVTVGGSVTLTDGNVGVGIEVFNEGSVIVEGSVTAIGGGSKGISATNADISVGGDVVGEYIGVRAEASFIEVAGNVASSAPAEAGPSYGITTKDDCEINIGGNVNSNYIGICMMEFSVEDPEQYNHSEISIDGVITAPEYIKIWDTSLAFEDYSGINPLGYRIYSAYADISDGGFPLGIVFVKEEGIVPVVPTAPQDFTAAPGDGQVALSWTAPASDGGDAISHYEVSRDNGSTWVTASTNTSHTFTGLTNGIEYTFKVRAVNSEGPGAEASATATPVVPEFAGGSGTMENPYLIETVDHLNNVRNYLGTENNDKHFKLSANLNLDVAPYNSGAGWAPIGTSAAPFTGNFDGDGHIISGLFINKAGAWNVRIPSGLFGYTGTDAEIRNLTLESLDITGCYYVGGLVGTNNGDIIDVNGSGNVVGEFDTGGLAGRNNGTITDSSFTGTVTGTDFIEYGEWTGGLVGYNQGVITNCWTDATVVSEGDSIGGLVGENYDGIITESYSSGTITGDDYTGGLVGSNNSEIRACYSLCSVNGDSDVGGLVGGNSGPIADSFAAGIVNGNMRKGGLAGSNIDAAVTNCYWDIETSGQSTSACGTGRSTANMKEQATFIGWDFDDVWGINGSDNNGYPFLRWQVYAAEPTAPTAPQNFIAEPGDGQVALSWTAPTGDGGSAITKYQVSKDNGANWTDVGLNTSYTFTGLTNGTTYTFKVRAINSAGNGAEASTTATPEAAHIVPTAPQSFTATPGDGQVVLSWTAPASDGGSAVTKYQVSKDNGANWTDVGLNTSHTFTGLTNGLEYTFKVRAVNSVGPGSEASTAATPSAPAHITHTVNFYIDSSLYASRTVIHGSALGANWPDNPTRNRYSFGGWFTGRNGSGIQYTSSTIINADIDLYAKWTYSGGGSGGNSDNGGRRTPKTPTAPPTPTTPSYKADLIAENTTKATLPVTVGKDTGTASLGEDPWHERPQGSTVITMPSIPGIGTYSASISVASLSTTDVQGTLTLNTNTGSITVPSDMLTGVEGINGNKAQITIGKGDKANLPKAVRNAIGDRPLVQLTLSIDGQQIVWRNPKAPVSVSIPYTPTAAELSNPESIVIWYIDGNGNIVSVPNGRYNPVTGTVTFTVTHFSYYAVGYNQINFKDVANDAWYTKAVSFIAAREITSGTEEGNFSPEAKLTRGQFMVMLLKAYGTSPDLNAKDNFADAGNTYYTGYLAAAKRLGISAGTGNNMFAPEKEITRQEMFTLLYNALNAMDQLPRMHGRAVGEADDQPRTHGRDRKTLNQFNDAGQVASWAKNAMEFMVSTGTIDGSNGALYPLSTTTRAEVAQVLYNLLSR